MSFQYITVQQFFGNSYVYPSSSLSISSIAAANTDPLLISDVRRIFDGKRVVFAGDSEVRPIYHDMATFLVNGHRLYSTDITVQNSEKLYPYNNECRVRADGRPGMSNYVDEHMCQWSPSSSIHYIYLASLDCHESNELLRFVQCADLVVFSSVNGDMNCHFGREIYFLSSHLIFHAHQVVSLYIYDTIRDRSSSISLLFNQHQFINLQSCIFMSVNPSTKLENVIKQVESSNRLISFTIKQPNDKNMNENNKWDLTRTILIHKSSYLRSVVLKYPYDYIDVSNYISIVSNTTSLNLLIIRYLYTIIKHEVLFQNNNVK
ncbi:unnamed protein product [Rotaria sordida]|uniref:Uncharacterized protein n=1 Tax=Rotaria sordida TaxID=392033 RepID=A0A814D3D9_9BILA|nr:unnamed protein product [Rotaria sordida]